ncbi:MAG: hypothetical protein H6733_13370 [Alphaproteobacteria bacterium]|nr:hypothetical protein [Alphaproteobacteria bacterium]
MSRHLVPVLLCAGLGACAAPDTSGLFNALEVHTVQGGAEADADLIALADAATVELRIALPGLSDPDLTDAVLAAWDRGVEVWVVVDVDHASDAGVAAIADAGIGLKLADGGLTYYDFGTNRDVSWTSTQTRMTHAFAVADRTEVVMASGAGDLLGGTRVVFTGHSEELGEDLLTEHNQLFGGSDATAVTAFNAMAKSIADIRWVYPSQDDELVEVWFNPQERAVKRITDAVYRATSSIRIVTEDFADEGLARALQRKAEDGFDVEVIVGASFGSTSSALSDVLRNQAPDVPLLQSVSTEPLPTIAFVDYDRARDGRYHMPSAMVLTHPILSAARLFADVEVVNDQLVDGALYVVEAHGAPTQPLQDLAAIYQDQRALAEDLR